MAPSKPLDQLNQQIIDCKRCPRLVQYCHQIGRDKRARYRDNPYWARPVPNFLPGSACTGDPRSARLLVVGLAPAAHGANRTGRMFTGDRSGDFLYRALHQMGFASQAEATDAADGLELLGTLVTAVVHCAPPGNKPTSQELEACSHWFAQTFDLLVDLRVILCLGSIALRSVLKFYQRRGWVDKLAQCPFGHAAEYDFRTAPSLLCSYHPSQQNTFTGRLTESMMLDVLGRARMIVE